MPARAYTSPFDGLQNGIGESLMSPSTDRNADLKRKCELAEQLHEVHDCEKRARFEAGSWPSTIGQKNTEHEQLLSNEFAKAHNMYQAHSNGGTLGLVATTGSSPIDLAGVQHANLRDTVSADNQYKDKLVAFFQSDTDTAKHAHENNNVQEPDQSMDVDMMDEEDNGLSALFGDDQSASQLTTPAQPSTPETCRQFVCVGGYSPHIVQYNSRGFCRRSGMGMDVAERGCLYPYSNDYY